MSVLHNLVAFSRGRLQGIQTAQRDWSPYLAHFTSFEAMENVRDAIERSIQLNEIDDLLSSADFESYEMVEEIASSNRLLSGRPDSMFDLHSVVSLSECTLPGLIGLAERYGRFGFVFERDVVFDSGGRPCFYVSTEYRELLIELYVNEADEDVESEIDLLKLLTLANTYTPVGAGRIQDYTHEREWRFFGDLEFSNIEPVLLVAPEEYASEVDDLFDLEAPVVPLQILHRWGI